jgi:predicted PurR-regulated permease PerM
MATTRTAAAYQRMLPTLATFVLVILVIGCLYWARPVLVPAALGILFTFLLSPVVLGLQRLGLRRTPAVVAVVMGASLLLGGLAWLFVAQVVHLGHQLPVYEQNVTRRIEEIRAQGRGGWLEKVQQFAARVTQAANDPEVGADLPPPQVEVVSPNWELATTLSALEPVVEPIASAGLVIVLVIFMLLNREDARNRLLSLVGHGRMVTTTKALDDAGHRIGRYLLAQFTLNVGFGFIIGGGLLLLQVPHALLWGLLAAFLRYIPLVGPWIAAVFPVGMSLLTSEGWLQPLLVVGLFVTFELISNMIVEPLVYGQSIGVSQAALIVAIAFWTWLWGPIGLMMAAPLTVCLVVLGKYVPQLKFFDVLLGDEPALQADVRLYQRLLARDQDEALELIQEQFQTQSQVQVFDRLLIPALVYARRDERSDRLTEEEARSIVEGLQDILEEADDLPVDAAGVPLAAAPPAGGPIGGGRLEILGCAADDEADEAALEMFRRLLAPQTFRLEILTTASLASEVVNRAEQQRPSVVLIAALPPGGLARTRLLCKRLRSRFPLLKIVIGRWGGDAAGGDDRQQLTAAGADYVATSLEESANQFQQLAQFLLPPADPTIRIDKPQQASPSAPASVNVFS